jgi:DNA-binding transcriptional ArsR family regulator
MHKQILVRILSQQAVSLHVKLLADCGLVQMEQRGGTGIAARMQGLGTNSVLLEVERLGEYAAGVSS